MEVNFIRLRHSTIFIYTTSGRHWLWSSLPFHFQQTFSIAFTFSSPFPFLEKHPTSWITPWNRESPLTFPLGWNVEQALQMTKTEKKDTLSFNFLSLPPELRIKVYEELLISTRHLTVTDIEGLQYCDNHGLTMGLLLTSRQVHFEASTVYQRNTLCFIQRYSNPQHMDHEKTSRLCLHEEYNSPYETYIISVRLNPEKAVFVLPSCPYIHKQPCAEGHNNISDHENLARPPPQSVHAWVFGRTGF
jgi:hypothetical protein